MLSSSPVADPLQQPLLADAYTYELRVVQQPLRARMCGFGEKDRRPCTPPPILRLIIRDRATGQPVDITHVDASFFTAACSLCSVDMGADMDLIQQQLRGPADSPPYQGSVLVASPTADATTSGGGSSAHALARGDTATASEGGLGLPFLGQATASTANIMTFTAGSSSTYLPDSEGPASPVRNLIGATVTTGAALRGLDEQPGVYFVFPDLSIRKDGTYRMMFRFFDLRGQSGDLLASETKIQATAYSDAFRVYSAKQFPGMMESTPLSKHFARQGVKIPVRKEAGKSDPDP